MNIDFKECPKCHGYGVLDNGMNCTNCGGHGRGGAGRGSGEVMIDRDTGFLVTSADLVAIMKKKGSVPHAS